MPLPEFAACLRSARLPHSLLTLNRSSCLARSDGNSTKYCCMPGVCVPLTDKITKYYFVCQPVSIPLLPLPTTTSHRPARRQVITLPAFPRVILPC